MITRPIWKLDKKTGRELKFYECIADAGKEINDPNVPCIYDCCRGKLKSWMGYGWRYATEKEIEAYNKNGELEHSRRKPKTGVGFP